MSERDIALLVGELRGEVRGLSEQIATLRGEVRGTRDAVEGVRMDLATHLTEHREEDEQATLARQQRQWSRGALVGLAGGLVPVTLGIVVKRLGWTA
jgi:hypothetical protein